MNTTQPAHEDDLRIASLQQAYRSGALHPRELIARLRARAAALNPEFRLFIRLLDEAELEPYLAALDGALARRLAALRHPVRDQGQHRPRRRAHHRGLPRLRVHAAAHAPASSQRLIAPAPSRSARPISTSSPPASTARARPRAPAATPCCRRTSRAARARVPRSPSRSAWPASRSAPTPPAPAACRRRSTTWSALKPTLGLLSTARRGARLPHARLRDVFHGHRARGLAAAGTDRGARSARCLQPPQPVVEPRRRLRRPARVPLRRAAARGSRVLRQRARARRCSRSRRRSSRRSAATRVEIDFAPVPARPRACSTKAPGWPSATRWPAR